MQKLVKRIDLPASGSISIVRLRHGYFQTEIWTIKFEMIVSSEI